MSDSTHRGVVVINSTLSFELQPEEEEEDRRDGAGAGEGVHLLFSPTPLEGDSAKGFFFLMSSPLESTENERIKYILFHLILF